MFPQVKAQLIWQQSPNNVLEMTATLFQTKKRNVGVLLYSYVTLPLPWAGNCTCLLP